MTPAPVRYRILGPLELGQPDGTFRMVGQGKCRALLAVLLVNANRTVPAGELLEQLWPDRAPKSAPKLVQQYVHRLRRALPAPLPELRPAGRDGSRLLTSPPGYRLAVDFGELDADRFTALARAARGSLAGGESGRAAEGLRRALAMWRGPLLADVPDIPAITTELVRLEEARLAATEAWAWAELHQGHAQDVVPELEILVAAHPLRESFRHQLMIALCLAGRRADALGAARQLRHVLAEELGIRPGADVLAMEQAIIRDSLADLPGLVSKAIGAPSVARGV
ncbi:BTAD domain-containing putative transcriptional regulator [Streptomyces sp. NPDC007875]|uniref:AfsR/SARP family transcriptional regulator n=1 Tax=Streptomyces sp. NPDC007875 TaxID=3364783 RepID=UPI0036989CC1